MPHHPPILPTRILKNIPLSSSRPRHTPTFHGIPPEFAQVLATRLSTPTRTHTKTKRESPHPRRACRKILALFFQVWHRKSVPTFTAACFLTYPPLPPALRVPGRSPCGKRRPYRGQGGGYRR